jgi:hypothetical protein
MDEYILSSIDSLVHGLIDSVVLRVVIHENRQLTTVY